jgi:hypothetical protein
VTGKVTHFSTEQIDVDVEAPAAGLVVLNEFMFTGWRVFVDGQEDTPLWVDLALRGVLVGPGKHHIVWRYVPPHWSLLVSLWLAGMAAFLAALFTTLRQRVT